MSNLWGRPKSPVEIMAQLLLAGGNRAEMGRYFHEVPREVTPSPGFPHAPSFGGDWSPMDEDYIPPDVGAFKSGNLKKLLRSKLSGLSIPDLLSAGFFEARRGFGQLSQEKFIKGVDDWAKVEAKMHGRESPNEDDLREAVLQETAGWLATEGDGTSKEF